MRLPIVTRCLALAVIVLSLCCGIYHILRNRAAEGSDENAANQADAVLIKLVLGKTPWWAIWTILTSGLVETQIVPFFIFLVVVCTGGKYCEKVWSPKSYAYFALTIVTTTTLAEALLWSIFSTPPTRISGANGLLAGIAVALRQLVPGHTIVLFRNKVRLQIRWLPISFMILVTILQLLGLEENISAYYIGFIGSWYYLRYHHFVDGIGYGDASDAFSFANFFPHAFAVWLEPIFDRMYTLLSKRLHIVRVFSSSEIEEANQRYAARLSGSLLPAYHQTGPRVTNERRKMMLKAMDKGI